MMNTGSKSDHVWYALWIQLLQQSWQSVSVYISCIQQVYSATSLLTLCLHKKAIYVHIKVNSFIFWAKPSTGTLFFFFKHEILNFFVT
jgi:hypothetical protein